MTLTVTPTVDLANWPPRVRLDVAASAGETSATVQRLDTNGNTVPVRTSDGNPVPVSGGAGLVYDYEAPFGLPASYTTAESPSTVSAQVTVNANQVWAIHPGVPALSMPVNNFRPGTFAKRSRGVEQGVFYPMGRVNPVVVSSGVRQGVQTTAKVLVRTAGELAGWDALLSGAAVLLLNIPTALAYSMSTAYVAVGQVDYEPVTGILNETWLDVTMPLTVVDRPGGGTQAQRTWIDVLGAYPTWNAVEAAYSTWNALLAGP